MKKLILITFLIAGTILGAQAQNHKKGAGKLSKTLTAKLNLTSDQQTKIDAILLSKGKKLDSLTTAAKSDTKAVKKGKKQINTDAELQIAKVLNANQKQVYADFKAAKKAKNKARAALNDTTGTPPLKQ
ncbi:hypothetical protein [Mucilaginibacter myungsuensis]|uniref:LTXXQ motif family protein n=1 Tax=Mucilaginibacter myungsuensis TaxID=649104 RepID=A0A929KW90_9SPHI|nr:hypothetical protein [Mucilaginibacter myungsuensis]MBE9662771.1 hypothetical protein [Mucilaginibacter myungsuensis]MDN3598191.1 hypothetical protein [Mucilaginibacter myungsuensis]